MSGHSKWSQIKHKKGFADQKKGKLFSKLSKIIFLAARKGVDPSTNLELKNAIEQARIFDMPNENIQRAISKSKDKDLSLLTTVHIEVMGPAGSAFVIEAITDNSNRTVAEIKNITNGYGFKMVAPRSLSWMFEQGQGEFTAKNPISLPEEHSTSLDNFISEIVEHEDVKEVYSNLK